MSIFDRPDFDELLAGIIYDSRVQSPDCDVVVDESEEWDDDGQPTHREEVEALEEDEYNGIY